MSKITAAQKIGIAVLVISFLAGTIGAAWNVYSSFGALDAAEFAGIGPVGDHIKNALLFSIGGVAGCVVGALLIVFGRSKANEDRRTRSDL